MSRLSGYLRTTALLLGTCLLPAAQSPAAEPAQCRFTKIADLPVTEVHDGLAVPVSVNGKSALMMIGTGAPVTLFLKSKIEQMALGMPYITGSKADLSRLPDGYQLTRTEDLAIGQWKLRGQFFVAGTDRSDLPANVIGTLGEDLLKNLDFELDLKGKKFILYQTEGCSDQSPPITAAGYTYVPLTLNNAEHWPRLLVDVEINGHPVKAMLGTEYAHTRLSEQSSEQLGLDLRGAQPVAAEFPSDNGGGKLVMAKVGSFKIGDEEVKPVWLRSGGSGPEPITDGYGWLLGRTDGYWQAVIGRDFLQNHHVLVSLSQHRFYYAYQGGEVFSPDSTRSAQAAQ